MYVYYVLFGEGNGTPLQYFCLENPMDGGAWWAAVHGVADGRTQLSDFTFTFHSPALEKEMATHSSVLAWRIPGTGEPSGLLSMGSHRVGHDWSDLAQHSIYALLYKILWWRLSNCQPSPSVWGWCWLDQWGPSSTQTAVEVGRYILKYYNQYSYYESIFGK